MIKAARYAFFLLMGTMAFAGESSKTANQNEVSSNLLTKLFGNTHEERNKNIKDMVTSYQTGTYKSNTSTEVQALTTQINDLFDVAAIFIRTFDKTLTEILPKESTLSKSNA